MWALACSRFSGVKSKFSGCSNGEPFDRLAHRSISPNTMSIEPMIATTSASMWPRHMKSVACRKAKPGDADLAAIGPVGAVGDEIDAELALRRLDRGVGLAGRHVIALGIELEVVDQRFHRLLHLGARRRRHLAVVDLDRPRRHLLERLPDDAHRLAHLLHAHEVAVVAIAVLADRNIEIHLVIDVIGLRLAQIPRDARAAQHRAGEAPIRACSAVTTPISTVRCLKMRFSVSRRSISSIVCRELLAKCQDVVGEARPAGPGARRRDGNNWRASRAPETRS